MAISITRLSGGNTPADGSDPRTFPAIWNTTAALLEANVGTGGGSITVSDTAPASPEEGDLWWDSGDGKLFVYYNDGSSSQWVDAAGPSVAVQDTAPTGYEGQLWLDSTDGSMYVYYTDPGGGASSWIGAVSRSGGILQVVSTTKTNVYSVSLGGGAIDTVDVPDLTATITPSSSSSKILVTVNIVLGGDTRARTGFVMRRDSTDIAIGDTGLTSRITAGLAVGPNETDPAHGPQSAQFFDSPATTSSVTYAIRLRNGSSSTNTLRLNQNTTDVTATTISTITLMEVAG